jgi:hypothetical protein
MSDSAPAPHSHDAGMDHEHATLAPEVEAFLQKIEAWANTLEPNEAASLRRLVQAGMAADPKTTSGDDTAGYHWTGYYHVHYLPYTVYVAPVVIQPVPVVYYPYWWYQVYG